MKKFFFLLLVTFVFADVNPFNAGDLNSPNPYGLTPQEKEILKNKRKIQSNTEEIEKLKSKLSKIKSSLTQKLLQYDQTISDLSDKLSSFNTILSEINVANASIEKLKKQLQEVNITDIYSKIENLDTRVSALESQVKAIQDSLKEITKVQNENFQYLSNSIQTILEQLKKSNKKLTPKEAFTQAKKAFFKGDLKKAQELFAYSLTKRYLPATSAFYLGEIAYRQGKYKDALAYYKKSVTIYPKKASFSAQLLYHTGISFLKLNQKQSAKLTFKKLITDFPKSKYANLAKKELEKL